MDHEGFSTTPKKLHFLDRFPLHFWGPDTIFLDSDYDTLIFGSGTRKIPPFFGLKKATGV